MGIEKIPQNFEDFNLNPDEAEKAEKVMDSVENMEGEITPEKIMHAAEEVLNEEAENSELNAKALLALSSVPTLVMVGAIVASIFGVDNTEYTQVASGLTAGTMYMSSFYFNMKGRSAAKHLSNLKEKWSGLDKEESEE